MSLLVPCPNCGERPHEEFTFGGELRPVDTDDPAQEFDRVFGRDNVMGPQAERWYHAFGCHRWVTLTRDTVSNRFVV
jgi:sarcosine oxidase subunit delta